MGVRLACDVCNINSVVAAVAQVVTAHNILLS